MNQSLYPAVFVILAGIAGVLASPSSALAAPKKSGDPSTPAVSSANQAVIADSHRAFLEKYCVTCHDADKQKGKVRLDDLPFEISDVATAERWQKVLGNLNAGQMPPEEEKQPTTEEKTAFLAHLSKQMVVARKALADTGGMITLRRLNRREYVNTMRDLLDVEVNPFDLPPDQSGNGFDTFGSGLFFSSDQFEQYVKLARAALNDAIVPARKPERKTGRLECEEAALKHAHAQLESSLQGLDRLAQWRSSGRPSKEFGFNDEQNAKSRESLARSGHLKAAQYLSDPLALTGALLSLGGGSMPILTIPREMPAGRYVVRVRAAIPEIEQGRRRFLEFGTEGDQGWPSEMRLLGCCPVEGTPETPQVFEFPVDITQKSHRHFAVRERCHNRSAGADQQRFFATTGNPMDTRQRKTTAGLPYLWVDWMEWEGPFLDQWPPRSHKAIFGKVDLGEKPTETEARAVLESFAVRAFRGKPVRPAFVDRLMEHFKERVQAGEPFFEAIKTPLSIILASPRFLYILEPVEKEPAPEQGVSALTPVRDEDGNATVQRKKVRPQAARNQPVEPQQKDAPKRVPLTNGELANRLSYFLWSGPPDERLMFYANTARLGDIQLLSGSNYENEVDRMLADRRSNRFIAGFVHQWLHMTRLDFFQFNARLYPKFDGSLKEAARREVYETIRTVLDEDLPLGTLLKSDFVVINDLLADYYGLPGVRGSPFRKVSVPDGVPRGGFLGMAAILAMGSDGERSSPVERGVWVLRKLLHAPPPPAPANVPQLSRFGEKLMPARELLLAHKEQPQCAQCHRDIDPIGFALQNFDAAGGWREQEYSEFFRFWKSIQKKELFPIDGSGRLPTGETFQGFYGLRDAVAAHEEDFARGLVTHLVEYALGRPGGFSDEALVEEILTKAKSRGMTLRAMIHALVESPQFHFK